MQVANVLSTLLSCYCIPELLDTSHQLILGLWLHFSSQKLLQFVPHVLDRIEIWWLGRSRPPIDVFLL